MKATKRESQPVKWVASNSRERSAAVSLNDRLTISTPGNPLGARQFPESETRRTPVGVRSTNTLGLEAVSGTGLGHLRILPATRRGDVLYFGWPPRFWLVFMDRRGGLESRIDDAPGFFNIILTRE